RPAGPAPASRPPAPTPAPPLFLVAPSAAGRAGNARTRPAAARHDAQPTGYRLPATGYSLLVEAAIGHQRDQVGQAAGVAPLVVVPGDHLDQVVANDHRREAVDDRGARVALEVHRDERLVGVAEDPLQVAFRQLLELLVDRLGARLLLHLRHEVDDRDGRRRDPQ